jgi:DNA transformation protein
VGAEDPEYLRELFAAFGPVSVRRMFGGAGIYAEGLMFALLAEGAIYLKADEESAADFEREGMTPFSYETAKGTRAVMSYWRMPDRLYDNPEELAEWSAKAAAAARRNSRKPNRSGPKVKRRK